MAQASAEFVSGKKYAPSHLGRVVILGLGKSGMAAARYCAELVGTRVDELMVLGGRSTDAAREFAASPEMACAKTVFDCETFDGRFDLCIVSPGIPQVSAFYRNAVAACAEVLSEVEFAWRESDVSSTWIAVTGTNGKTTTVSLAAHIARQAGLRAAAVGNIGDTCIDAVRQGETDVYVAEVSSFQLASTVRFAPDVAVLMNIKPDHLNWHGGFEAYSQAKLKIFENLASSGSGLAVLDAVDDEARAVVRNMKAQSEQERGFDYIPLGTAAGLSQSMIERCGSQNAAWCEGDVLAVHLRGAEYRLCAVDELQIKGAHNVSNALAASCCALALGLSEEAVADGLRTFEPLAHRIEPCGSVNGVACYNDSKATNVDAALKALTAFPAGSIVALLGGCDKGTDLSELVSEAQRTCRAVVCFGAAAPRFLEAFSSAEGLTVLRAGRMEEALDVALSAAEPGDTVILSPACSSFDEFDNYPQRGEVFKALCAVRAAAAEDRG